MSTREVAERVGDESLADADGTENDDVPMRLQKSPSEHSSLKSFRSKVILAFLSKPLDAHVGIELRRCDAVVDGGRVAPRDLVGEHEREQLSSKGMLCAWRRERDAIRQRVDHATETQASKRRDEAPGRNRGAHRDSFRVRK